MKSLVKRLVIYSSLTLIIGLTVWNWPAGKPPSSLGNFLCAYFYYTSTSITADLPGEHKTTIANTKSPELKRFLESLDWTKQEELLDFYKSDFYYTWNQTNWNEKNWWDGSEKSNYLKYWQAMRPKVRQVYQEKLKVYSSKYPIVHFRCSDSPFNKAPQYHLTKQASVEWMAEQIKQRGYQKVTMLSCSTHRRFDHNSCKEYTDFYVGILRDSGLEVETACHSILQDFSLMVNSPLLVALNASSFSFMAGIAKAPQDFISCNMGVEIDGKHYRQTSADWILDHRDPLLHSDVQYYDNTVDVITKLRVE